MDQSQRQRFKSSVERKKEEARRASEQPPPQVSEHRRVPGEEEAPLHDTSHPQDTRDPRAKGTRHKKQTADKY